ncbi:type II secretion system minor pseudopilin GspI [Vibrio sp. JC009]|uniref:type II secretion system minor pseudopilin GspI n=1 Tax=Vibrio sp. JC009 TaxID=2912314 RepID=UPI0023AFF57F|nr:type II secretion system minor pseudopilin GspI [Vibrio sp. JC009]WED21930.1 type II secretion system minor pseudopilin GspI [Vibrio sp. JC009]
MRTSKGMTLLEVLVALAIFATASLSIIRAVSQHTNTLRHLEEKTFASMVVDNQMALVLLDGVPSSAKTGKTEMAGRTWYWKVAPVPTVADYITGFDVSVSTEPGVKNPVATVRSYAPK